MYLDIVLPAFTNHQLSLCYLLLSIETDKKTPQIHESCADSTPPYKAFPLVNGGCPKGKKFLKVLGWREVEEKRREHPRTETLVS